MKILIVAGMRTLVDAFDYEQVIGVDRGNLFLIEQGITPDVAVGDFDSVNSEEFEKIDSFAKKIIKLPSLKDETDLEVALDYATKQFPQAEIEILGALGGRLDHHLTNLYLPLTKRFVDYSNQISLKDQQNIVEYLKPGRHELIRKPDKKYIGFVQVNTEWTLEIQGAKYPLKANENFADIYASNEFITEKMSVSFEKGMVIVIYSSDNAEPSTSKK